MPRQVRKNEKAQLHSFAVVDAPKARTAYALYLKDQYPQYNNSGMSNQQRISVISRSWKVLAPNVKDKYQERAREESIRRHTHIDTKINVLSTPLSPSRLPQVTESTSSVTMIGGFVLEQKCQIGILLAGRHKMFQWKACVKLMDDMSKELAVLRSISRELDVFDWTGVLQLIGWGDSNDIPSWLAFEYFPRTLQECLAEDGPIQPRLVAAFFIQLKHGLWFVQKAGYCHSHINPANLMVDFQSQQMKLCNFESSVPCDKNNPDSEGETELSLCYNARYRAPELWPQCTAEYTGLVTVATESWAFACCLVEALTAEPLFPTLGSIQAYWHNDNDNDKSPNDSRMDAMKKLQMLPDATMMQGIVLSMLKVKIADRITLDGLDGNILVQIASTR